MGSVAQQCNTNTFIVQSIIGMQIQIWVLSIQCVAVNVMPDKPMTGRKLACSHQEVTLLLCLTVQGNCHVMFLVQ